MVGVVVVRKRVVDVVLCGVIPIGEVVLIGKEFHLQTHACSVSLSTAGGVDEEREVGMCLYRGGNVIQNLLVGKGWKRSTSGGHRQRSIA